MREARSQWRDDPIVETGKGVLARRSRFSGLRTVRVLAAAMAVGSSMGMRSCGDGRFRSSPL